MVADAGSNCRNREGSAPAVLRDHTYTAVSLSLITSDLRLHFFVNCFKLELFLL